MLNIIKNRLFRQKKMMILFVREKELLPLHRF